MRATLLLITCLAFSVTLLPAQGKKPARLRPDQARAVERDLVKYQKGDEAERQEIIHKLSRQGDATFEYLRTRDKEDLLAAEIPDIIAELQHLEGRDLLEKKMTVPASPWSCWSFKAGEVVVLEKGDADWGGIRVDPKVDPKNGVITLHLAESKDPLLPLGGPLVKRRSEKLQGVKVPGNPNRVKAYDDRDYTFTIFGQEVVIRSIGPEAFLYRHDPGSPKAARTTKKKFGRIKPSDPKLIYREAPNPEYGNIARRVQQYLFRIIPGVEPLPTYDTPDEKTYAFAEHVQVEIREEDRGTPVLLVAFPFEHELGYDRKLHDWLLRFADRVGGIAPADVVLWVGNEGAHEANKFWNGKKMVRPKGKLLKRIRDLFPEDY